MVSGRKRQRPSCRPPSRSVRATPTRRTAAERSGRMRTIFARRPVSPVRSILPDGASEMTAVGLGERETDEEIGIGLGQQLGDRRKGWPQAVDDPPGPLAALRLIGLLEHGRMANATLPRCQVSGYDSGSKVRQYRIWDTFTSYGRTSPRIRRLGATGPPTAGTDRQRRPPVVEHHRQAVQRGGDLQVHSPLLGHPDRHVSGWVMITVNANGT